MVQFLVTLQVLALTAVERARDTDRERGATAVEYGLMVALIAAGIVAIVTLLRDDLRGVFQGVINATP